MKNLKVWETPVRLVKFIDNRIIMRGLEFTIIELNPVYIDQNKKLSRAEFIVVVAAAFVVFLLS